MSVSSSSSHPSVSSSDGSLRASAPLSSFAPLTVQPSTVPPRKPRSLFLEWALAGSATMGACLFSNPAEVVKTRMQVQNELAARGAAPLVYRNAFQAFVDIGRKEGLRGLQGGLGPSLLYQLTMNGTRLGLYEPLKRSIRDIFGGPGDITLGAHNQTFQPPVFWHNVLASGLSGSFAAFIGSPFFLVKVRLQVQSKMKHAPIAATGAAAASAAGSVSAQAGSGVVGAQHAYTSALGGLRAIYNADGIPGLFRGAPASMIRVTTGSVVQLSTYDSAKHEVRKRTGWGEGVKLHFAASLLSGFLVAVAMNPPDVISTRLYNQPVVAGKGTLYSSWIDCASKTVKTEGVRGLYKGFLAHYLRLGPHTILTFVFWEQLKALATKADL